VRHHEVRDDHVWLLAGHHPQRLLAIVRSAHTIPLVVEDERQEVKDRRVIVGDQDAGRTLGDGSGGHGGRNHGEGRALSSRASSSMLGPIGPGRQPRYNYIGRYSEVARLVARPPLTGITGVWPTCHKAAIGDCAEDIADQHPAATGQRESALSPT